MTRAKTVAEEQPRPDFVSLFNGENLDGWSLVSTDRFSVNEGVIVNDGGTGWLRSNKTYKDFELKAEFRIAREGSDSGLFFRASFESMTRPPNWPLKCYQLQLIDAPGLFMLFGHGAPCLFDRNDESLRSAMKEPGEWQTIHLKVVGDRAEASLNGVLVTVSDSLAILEGHLGLQGENGHVEWRALRVKELPSQGS